jgi:hypothetical protein
MKHLIGKKQTKKVKFAGGDVEIRKLSINDVMAVRDTIEAAKEDSDQMRVLRDVLRMAVVGADEMTDEEFNEFSPSDLNELSETILQYCGLSSAVEEVGNSPAKKK